MACNLGRYNPFRYRGYVFDEETQMYYLNSRYYYPELRRFINADRQFDKGARIGGCNLFTYCTNNPVMRVDNEGQESIDITECLNKEMRDAYREIGWYNLLPDGVAEYVFYQNVKSGGKWNLKAREDWGLRRENTYTYNGIALRSDEPGNIPFSYVGSQLFSLAVLRAGAGLYQQISNTSSHGCGEWWPNFGDDPMDAAGIEYGFRLRKKQNLDFSMFGLSNLIRYDIFDGEFRRTHDKED